MSFNPFFDVSGLTTDELLKKQAEVGKKMATARAAGANAMVLSRLQDMMNQINEQFMLNSAKEQAEAMKENDGKDEFDDSISIG
jgi:hypothetical protein